MAEGARLAGDAGRVALLPDCGDLELADAFGDERPRPHLLARPTRYRARLAGQDRLVERQAVRRLDPSVRHDLVARLDAQEVADDDIADADRAGATVSYDGGGRRDERGEPVERLLRPHLLDDPDRRVEDEDPEEQRV